MGFNMEEEYMSTDGQMGCDVMGGLTGIWEDEAAWEPSAAESGAWEARPRCSTTMATTACSNTR